MALAVAFVLGGRIFVCSLLGWITLHWKTKVQSLDKMAAKYVPEPEEVEQLILEAITKITSAKSKQRASSEKNLLGPVKKSWPR